MDQTLSQSNDLMGLLSIAPTKCWKFGRIIFSSLGTPKDSESFDAVHYRKVTNFMKSFNANNSNDDIFLVEPFHLDEVQLGIKTLNKGKAAGFYDISTEHLAYGGIRGAEALCPLLDILCELKYNPALF